MQQLSADFAWVLHRCRQRFACALAFTLAMRALNLVLLAPLAAGILRLGLFRFGRASVGNFELLAFGLTPEGILSLLGVGTILLTATYLELAGLLRLLADDSLHWWQAFRGNTRLFARLVHLGLRQLLVYLVLAIPFAASIGVVYWLFWSGKDLNGLIVLRPPVFWWGASLAAAIVLSYAIVAAAFLLRWLYAVPIICLESTTSVAEVLRESTHRAWGRSSYAARLLGVWATAAAIVAYAAFAASDYLSQEILRFSSWSLSVSVIATAGVLLVNGLVAFVISALINLTLAAAVLALYRRSAPDNARIRPSGRESSTEQRHLRLNWILTIAIAGAVILSSAGSFWAVIGLEVDEPIEITAHRAGAAHAPENTLAALERAIVDGADWAEIDVQNTSDGQLVIMHDIDLARIGGGNRRVDQATLAEIQQFDVGSQFGPEFAGEKIATLAEFLAAASGRIRLNIELKPHNRHDAPVLTRRVVEQVRQAGLIERSHLCSQSYESIQLARQLEPRLKVGFIAATTIGSPERLAVDFLMVKSSLASRRLVDRAARREIDVHAWTVNDPLLVAPLLDAGVTNLITDDPRRIRAQVDEIRHLDAVQRLLLGARNSILR